MKKVAIIFLLVISLLKSKAQDNNYFQKNSLILNAGLGFGYFTGYGLFSQGYSQLPYFNFSLDYSFYNLDKGVDLGLGGYLGYTSWSYKRNEMYYTKNGNVKTGFIKQKWSVIHFGFRPTIHYALPDAPLDLYGGLLLGYGVASYSVNDPDFYYTGVSYSRPYWGIFAGGRYFFNSKVGGYLELGYAMSILNLGLSFKLQ